MPHRQPLSSVTPRLRALPRGTRDRPASCVTGGTENPLDTSPSGYLSYLAHMYCKIRKVEPTLVGRILTVGLTCTNLRRSSRVTRYTQWCRRRDDGDAPGVLSVRSDGSYARSWMSDVASPHGQRSRALGSIIRSHPALSR